MKKKISFLSLIFILLLLTVGNFACSKKITITFDSDGGTVVSAIELDSPSKIDKPEDPVLDRAIFDGWYLGDKLFDFESEVTKSITLKAKWIEAVSLSISGPGVDEQEILVPKGVSYDLFTPSREGYRFVSWVDTSTNLFIESPYTFYEDTFLQAKWEKKDQYIVYYYNGTKQLQVDYIYEGDEYTPYLPDIEGFNFVCWCIDSALTTECNFNSLGRSNILYAKLEPKTYTISFNQANIKPVSVQYNTLIGTLPEGDYDKRTCTFVGWEYEGKLFTKLSTYKYAKDITVNAVIQTKTTFVVEGVRKNVTYTIGDITPYVTAEKEGYIFAGWYENSDFTGDAVFTITDDSFANKTVYAKFISEDDENNTYTNKVISHVRDYYMSIYEGALLYEDQALNRYDDFYGTTLTWESSNNSLITNAGKLKRQSENKDAILTLTIEYNGIKETVDLNVTIKAQIYKDISKSVIASYVYTGTYNSHPVDEILLDTADVLYLSFTDPKENGEIVQTTDYLNKYSKFKEQAIEKGVRVVMCIGGSNTSSVFTAIAKDDIARSRFVNEICEAIVQNDFAGVDIDWEYPSEQDASYFTLLMHDIYEAVKDIDPELLVTSAIPAGPWGYPKFDLRNSIQYLDFINMMSYDLQCSGVGAKIYHHCALYKSTMTYNMCSADESVKYWNTKLGVPLSKIVIGGAFYGKYSTVTSLTGTITSTSVGVSIRYNVIDSYLSNSDWTEYWDDVAKAPYLYNSKEKIFVTYENERSLKAKCDYIKQNGVRGLMWWDYGSDSTGKLIKAVNDKLADLK